MSGAVRLLKRLTSWNNDGIRRKRSAAALMEMIMTCIDKFIAGKLLWPEEMDKLKADVERLRNIVSTFGTHSQSCSFWTAFNENDCDCDWLDLVLEFRPEE